MSLLNSRNGKLLLVRYLSNHVGVNRLILSPFVFFPLLLFLPVMYAPNWSREVASMKILFKWKNAWSLLYFARN